MKIIINHCLKNLLLTTFSSEILLLYFQEFTRRSSISFLSIVLSRYRYYRDGRSIISIMMRSSFWLANYSSQNYPDQITRIQRRWQAKTQTSPNMQGQEMSPKGKVTLLGMLTKTQAMPPKRKSTVEVTRQTRVLRELSNLRRQESSMPGKTMEVMGSHAHFWLQVGLSVGNCISTGQLQELRKRLLQDSCYSMQMMMTMMSYSDIVTRKARPAIFRFVNFRILIRPTQMQIDTMSFRKMLLSLKYQPTVKPTPMARLITYMIRNSKEEMLKSLPLRALMRKRKITSFAQMDTPTIPSTKHRKLRQMMSPRSEKMPMTTPMASSTMKSKSSQMLISIPLPPKDQGLEYMATRAIIIVMRMISSISPHSKVLLEQSALQQTQQVTVAEKSCVVMESSRMSKQLRQWMGVWQLLVTRTGQRGGRQVLVERVGLMLLQRGVRVMLAILLVEMRIVVGVLF